MDLNGKVAVVTGGADGLGRAAAAKLAQRGAHVLVVDIDRDAGAAAAAAVGGTFLHADVGDPGSWSRIAEHEPAVAVLNAGINPPLTDVTRVSDEDYARIKAVNIDQVVFGMRALVPVMREQGEGCIFVVASLSGLIPAGLPIYVMTKHAVVGLVRIVAPALALDGITVNCICPGVMDTKMAERAVERLRDTGRSAEVIEPSQVADVIVHTIVGDDTGRVIAYVRGDEAPFDVAAPDIPDSLSIRSPT